MYDEHAIVRAKGIGTPGENRWEVRIIPWGPQVADRIGVIHATPEEMQLYPILGESIPRMWEAFKSAAFVKDWLLDTHSYMGKEQREQTFGDSIGGGR